MTAEEQDYAATLAAAIATDLSDHPPAGPLVRLVLRWVDADDPLHFTIHALGEDEQEVVAAEEAWYPLEWPNAERELVRTERVNGESAVRRAGEALRPQYEAAADERDEDAELSPSDAIVETVRALPAALVEADVELDGDFAVSASHFEGFGALAVLQDVAPPALLAALEARGELPVE